MADGKVVIDTELDSSGIEQGLKEAEKKVDNSSGKLNKIGSALSGSLGVAGKATAATLKATAVSAGAAAAAIGGVVSKSVSAYASYEQLAGGIDTLFKKSSKQVQKYADEAYKTAQISANDYMELTTSFSASLLQGLGGDTEKAAKISNKAIIDMSDNANKMGTDMELIQNAYQGFAKDNFTMLDNLKLGYGGTKSEMARLINDSGVLGDTLVVAKGKGANFDKVVTFDKMIEAIHKVQTNLGITGTSAKEASSTIEGSVNSAKSAWTNLLTGMSRDDANFEELVDQFVDSAVNALNNLLPRVQIALTGVGNLINALLPQLLGYLPELINSVGPGLINSILSLFNIVATSLQSYGPTLLDNIKTYVEQIISFIGEQAPLITSQLSVILSLLISALRNGLPALLTFLVQGLSTAIDVIMDNLPVIIDTGMKLLNALKDGILKSLPMLISALPGLVKKIVNGITNNAPKLILSAYKLIKSLSDGLVKNIPTLIKSLPKIIAAIVKGLIKLASGLISVGVSIIKDLASGILKNTFKLVSIGMKIGETLMNTITDKLIGIKNVGKNLVEGLWNGINDMASWIKNKIEGFGKDVLNKLKSFFGIHSPSKLMHDEIGVFLAKGIWEGFDDENPMKNIQKSLQGTIDGMNTRITSKVDGVIHSSTVDYSKIGDAMVYSLQKSGLTVQIGQRQFGRIVREVI